MLNLITSTDLERSGLLLGAKDDGDTLAKEKLSLKSNSGKLAKQLIRLPEEKLVIELWRKRR